VISNRLVAGTQETSREWKSRRFGFFGPAETLRLRLNTSPACAATAAVTSQRWIEG